MTSAHPLGEPRHVVLADGRRLHYRRAGSGAPTVVFESGMGFSSAAWGRVLPEIAPYATTIAHDRAGYGQSETDAAPRTLARLADDLGELLGSEPGPLVLVGHSWGGPVLRTLAARRTVDVRAMILVDQTDENIASYFSPALAARMSRPPRFSTLAVRLSVALLRGQALRGQPSAVRTELRRDLGRLDATMAMELPEFLPSLRALRDDAGHAAALDGIDVTVITGTRAGPAERTRRREINTAHAATAERLGGRLVPATRSGHNVMFQQPELVVAEILRAIEDMRRGSSFS